MSWADQSVTDTTPPPSAGSTTRAPAPERPEAEVIDAILDRIAAGDPVTGPDGALVAEGMAERTFFRRVRLSDELRAQYVAALQSRGLVHADRVHVVLAAQPPLIEERDHDGNPTGEVKFDAAFVAHQKNRADGFKWDAARMQPKLYGDKLEVTGTDGGPLLVVRDWTGRKPKPNREEVADAA